MHKDYANLKKKRKYCMYIMLISIVLTPFIFPCLLIFIVSTYLHTMYNNEIMKCPHCGKNQSFHDASGAGAIRGTYIAETRKCKCCGGDLPEEMF